MALIELRNFDDVNKFFHTKNTFLFIIAKGLIE
jgi:hypothetical protein